MLMVIRFPVPHADESVNSNHKKGACPSGHGPFFVCNRLNQDLQDFRICRIEIRKGKRKVLTPYSEGQIEISIARRGCPWENGYAERLIRTLKEEEVHLNDYEDIHEARTRIGHFITQVYNHYSLDNVCEVQVPIFKAFLIFLRVSHANLTRRKIPSDIRKGSPSGAECV